MACGLTERPPYRILWEESEVRATGRRDVGERPPRDRCEPARQLSSRNIHQPQDGKPESRVPAVGWYGRSGEFDNLSISVTSRARRPDPGGHDHAPPGHVVVRYSPSSFIWRPGPGALPSNPWNAWSAWPGHPAILPPLPRLAKSAALADLVPAPIAPVPQLSSTASGARALRHIPAPRHEDGRRDHRASRSPIMRPPRAAQHPAPRPAPSRPAESLTWPESFDDWMMDIVRRRALRLNSGARRRGVTGSVRAVELAHILERSADSQGRWRCALCHNVVTLDDLSFDHVVALADGGEHAAQNLVPAHRKCNEIKGSEKAQGRAQALDRWLAEWAASHSGATPKGAARYPARPPLVTEPERRYA